MAIYHLRAKIISRSKGQSTVAGAAYRSGGHCATHAAAYRSGERLTDECTGRTFDYGRKQGIVHTEILAPGNAPAWAYNLLRTGKGLLIGQPFPYNCPTLYNTCVQREGRMPMSETRPLKDDHVQPGDAFAPPSEEIQKARDMIETARDLIAHAHQALDTARQLIKSKKEILQYNQARREYEAEHRASAPPVPDEAGIDILLITESPVDIARFRYALERLPSPVR